MSTSQTVPPPISAAAYVRTATENQDSASNQMDTIREYADRRGIQIVKEYSDAGVFFSWLKALDSANPVPEVSSPGAGLTIPYNM